MSTETAFPETHREHLKKEFAASGASGVIAFIEDFPPDERLKLYYMAHTALFERDGAGQNFDEYCAVVNAGIAEGLRQSEEEADPEKKNKLLDIANIMSFNFTANLAECWPGDNAPRERRHFEEGLRAAENCIRWRDQLGKPPDRKALAHWARGMHAMSLRDFATALEAFRDSLALAMQGAEGAGKPATISHDAGFDILLGNGYVGLAEITLGMEGGRERYDGACEAFRAQVAGSDDKEVKEDAEFGLAQLKKVEEKFTAGDRAASPG